MAYRSTVNYFLSETINRIRHPLFPSYTTNDYSSYTYVVYDGIGRGWEFSGLRVYQNADIVFEQECKHQGVLQYDYSTVNAPEGELPY